MIRLKLEEERHWPGSQKGKLRGIRDCEKHKETSRNDGLNWTPFRVALKRQEDLVTWPLLSPALSHSPLPSILYVQLFQGISSCLYLTCYLRSPGAYSPLSLELPAPLTFSKITAFSLPWEAFLSSPRPTSYFSSSNILSSWANPTVLQ